MQAYSKGTILTVYVVTVYPYIHFMSHKEFFGPTIYNFFLIQRAGLFYDLNAFGMPDEFPSAWYIAKIIIPLLF